MVRFKTRKIERYQTYLENTPDCNAVERIIDEVGTNSEEQTQQLNIIVVSDHGFAPVPYSC